MAIQTINTIKQWFKTGLKPSQTQFWDTWDSFRHKYEKVPFKEIEDLETTLNEKAEKSQLQEHTTNIDAHAGLFNKKEDKANKGIANGYVPLDEFAKITAQYLTIVNDLITGGATSLLSAQQGVILQSHIDSINKLLTSDNINLNTIQKIVDAIEQIQISLNTILVNDLTTGGITKALTAEMGKLLQTSKEDKSQKGLAGGYVPLNEFTKIANQYLNIVNNLTTGGSTSLLSAEQGVVLQGQIDAIKTLLSSNDVNLDTIQEIVDAIKEVESYLENILVNDLATGGMTKALTAEMGKQLNLIKLTATIATDAETQIIAAIEEDNKVVSRSKLFNWWGNIKTKAQTITAIWNFNLGIRVNNSTGSYVYTTQMLEEMFMAQLVSAGYGTYKIQYGWNDIKMFKENLTTTFSFLAPTQNNNINLPNKSGTVALANDFITTAVGTISTPPLIIPYGTLTTTAQNGAIERDENGILYETHNSVRSQIATTEYITSGAYTPSLQNIQSITGATLVSATYQKVGNIVNVMVALTATSIGLGSDVIIEISLPFNRSISTSLLSGIATGATINVNFSAQVYVIDISKAVIKYKASTTGFSNVVANFSYNVN